MQRIDQSRLGWMQKFWQPLRPGMDSRPVQRKETQRSDDRQTLQYLQVRGLQRTRHRPATASLHRQRPHDGNYPANARCR